MKKIANFVINNLDDSDQQKNLKGYLVESTASINIEDQIKKVDFLSIRQNIIRIAQYLTDNPTENAQITIHIHGYANSEKDVEKRNKEIYDYAKTICKSGKNIFIGYRWPAEQPTKVSALQALPTLPLIILITSLLALIVVVITLLIKNIFLGLSLSFVIGVGTILIIAKLADALSLLWKQAFLIPLLFLIFSYLIIFKKLNPIVNYLLNLINSSWQVDLSLLPWRTIVSLISTCLISVILTLILLRVVSYLRDRDRAANYGVLDLVNLIRQLDLACFNQQLINHLAKNQQHFHNEEISQKIKTTINDYLNSQKEYEEKLGLLEDLVKIEHEIKAISDKIKNNRIPLNFTAHSLGCFVVTNVVRILSDVFDIRSIEGEVSPDIGRVFSLGRLVLVAPDIPVETIITRRANYLASSVTRFQESFVFSNEGDLAVRLASTAANYISFPAKTRFSGYKLGNITARHFKSQTNNQLDRQYAVTNNLKKLKFGIINYHENCLDNLDEPIKYLEVRASDKEHRNLQEPPFIDQITSQENLSEKELIANQFTYFDCTDYTDYRLGMNGKTGILSYALKKPALNMIDYFWLFLAYFLRINLPFSGFRLGFFVSENRWINTHGGYFEGNTSRQIIYGLAFLGAKKFLDNIEELKESKSTTPQNKLANLNDLCHEHQIQVVLAPKFFNAIK